MIKDDSRVGTLLTQCMCHSTLRNTFKHSKKSTYQKSSYQRLKAAPTKPALARLFGSFPSKCASPCGLLTHRQERRGSACPQARCPLFSLAWAPAAVKVTRGIRFFFGVYLISRFSRTKLIRGLACIMSMICPTTPPLAKIKQCKPGKGQEKARQD